MAHAQLPLDDVKAVLLQRDAAFRQLVLEHHELDERIRLLSALTFLSNDQQLQEHALKKQKLALKDRIEAMARDQEASVRSA
jgi:uncharacterized protein YdcH (DUF465 family)